MISTLKNSKGAKGLLVKIYQQINEPNKKFGIWIKTDKKTEDENIYFGTVDAISSSGEFTGTWEQVSTAPKSFTGYIDKYYAVGGDDKLYCVTFTISLKNNNYIHVYNRNSNTWTTINLPAFSNDTACIDDILYCNKKIYFKEPANNSKYYVIDTSNDSYTTHNVTAGMTRIFETKQGVYGIKDTDNSLYKIVDGVATKIITGAFNVATLDEAIDLYSLFEEYNDKIFISRTPDNRKSFYEATQTGSETFDIKAVPSPTSSNFELIQTSAVWGVLDGDLYIVHPTSNYYKYNINESTFTAISELKTSYLTSGNVTGAALNDGLYAISCKEPGNKLYKIPYAPGTPTQNILYLKFDISDKYYKSEEFYKYVTKVLKYDDQGQSSEAEAYYRKRSRVDKNTIKGGIE